MQRLRSLLQWRGWRAPACTALAIQLAAALLVLGGATLLLQIMNVTFSVGQAVVLQGVFAALLSAWRRMPRWWIPIQLLFPVALLATLGLQLPPALFFCGFVFLLALYWSTFRTQVPFYPSRAVVWRAVLAQLPAPTAVAHVAPLRFIDIGSGLGGLVLSLAAARADGQFHGIELAPLPWLVSWLRARASGSQARFVRGDYNALDFSQFDVIFAYLSPTAMPALWQKAQREMRPGTLLLSYEFLIPDQAPQISVLPDPQGPKLYGWRH
ncbi:MAG: class I SAM-dependent methyltransferase [Herminiimonas sp.]|nr:class I SAM-dependent methyltransferase [Herminiimonas sp.]